jgi:nucleoside-diphosphate-sugar epimerase
MHVLLTGASGFVGQHLLRRLVREGHEVTCLARESALSKVQALGGRPRPADLLDPSTLSGLPDGIDVVFHLVGGGRVSAVGDAGLADLRRLNVDTTVNLLQALPRPPRKMILFSSVSAQGVRDGEVVREDTPCLPRSPHEIAKRESEVAAEAWCAEHAVPLAILRPAQVYGPGDVRSEIPTMLRLLRMGVFPVFGSGDNLMVPMIHVADVVEFALRALALNFEGRRYFTLTGRQFTVAETASIFSRVVGRQRGWLHVPKRGAHFAASTAESLCKLTGKQPPFSRVRIDNMTSQRAYDNAYTVRELGFAPTWELAEGIREAYDWYLAVGTRGLMKGVADYYPIALAEGEGVGTAYEYLAKWRVLHPMLAEVRRLLIAGLPEKYGSSLDFVSLAAALDADLVVVDEREAALLKLREAITRAGLSPRATFFQMPPEEVATMGEAPFDLALSCEVLQRLQPNQRDRFVRGLAHVARRFVVFTPNAGNRAHASRSHLRSLSIDEVKNAISAAGARLDQAGFVDMPPFPPGLTLSQDKRQQVKQAWWQRPALEVLGLFCRAERMLPSRAKQPFAHIVYAVASSPDGCT